MRFPVLLVKIYSDKENAYQAVKDDEQYKKAVESSVLDEKNLLGIDVYELAFALRPKTEWIEVGDL